MVGEGSEVEVQAELENRRLRERLELVRRVAATRCRVVAFRIAAAVVRPLLEVAGREHEAAAVRTRVREQRLRDLERHGGFAPLHERAGLHVAVERLFRREDRRHVHRLLLERRGRVEQAVAVRARAANALRVVVVLIAAAPVEQVLDADPVVEQVDARRERRQVAGLGISAERSDAEDGLEAGLRIGGPDGVRHDLDLIHGQDAVAVLVVPPDDRLCPDAADRIARYDPVRHTDLRRGRTKAHDLVGVHRRRQMEVEAELSAIEQLTAKRHFQPGVLDRAEIGVLSRRSGAERRRDDRADQRVVRHARVVRDVELDPVVEELRVEAGFPLGGTFGLQAVVADGSERLNRRVGVLDAGRTRRVGAKRVVRARLYAGGAVRETQLEVADRAEDAATREEILVGDDPRKARLRIEHPLELGAERAVLVGADGGGQIQTIAQRGRLLDENAPRLLDGKAFRGRCRRAGARRDGARRKRRAARAVLIEAVVAVLRAQRGLEVQPRKAGRIVVRRRAEVGRQVGDVRTGIERLTVAIRRAERPAFAVHVKARVVTIGEVRSEVRSRLQPARRTPVEVRRQHHAVDVLLQLLGPDLAWGAGAIADQRVGETADETIVPVSRAAECLRADAHRVVRLVARQRFDRVVAEVDGGVELRVDLRADVRAKVVQEAAVRTLLPRVDRDAERVEAVPLVGVELEHAHFIVAARRHEVANLLRAAVHLKAARLAVAEAERRDRRILDRAVDAKAVVALRAVALHARAERDHDEIALTRQNELRLGRRVHSGKRIVVRIPVAIVEDAAFTIRGPLRRTSATLLRRDHDDAVRCVGAVERCR